MQSIKLIWKLAAVLALIAILSGCGQAATPIPPTLAPTEDPRPTFEAVQTQAVATAVFAMTQNAPTATPVTPTNTPEPTNTQAPTNTPLPPQPTATATNVFIPWTKTPTLAPADYACTVTATKKSVADVKVGTTFDTTWSLKNTGTKTWVAGDLDVRYSSGDKLQSKGDVYDLGHDVAPNGTIDVVVDMKAPANDGTYNTTWVIGFPDNNTCTLTFKVDVSK